jgi:Uma2 family endonuclease
MPSRPPQQLPRSGFVQPLDCGPEEQPEPDLAVVVGPPRQYKDRHPRGDETILVVEVSRTTQDRDHEKATIYATARVPEHWFVDLPNRRVELYRSPQGDRYALAQLLRENEDLVLPGTSAHVRIAELFA